MGLSQNENNIKMHLNNIFMKHYTQKI